MSRQTNGQLRCAVLAAATIPVLIGLCPIRLEGATWGGGTGEWGTASNWVSGTRPTQNDDVWIDGGSTETGSVVTISSASASARNLTIDSGDTLKIGSNIYSLNLGGNLVVDGTLNIGDYSSRGTLNFTGSGPCLIGGSGQIVFDASIQNYSTLAPWVGGGMGPLTLGGDLTIRGTRGQIRSSSTVINEGTVVADVRDLEDSGLTISQVENHGLLRATNDAKLTIYLVSNQGTIEADNGRITLYGNLRSDQFGTIIQKGASTLTLAASVDNAGRSWDLDTTTGAMTMIGSIRGGTVLASGGSHLNARGSLYATSIQAPLDITSTVNVFDGITLSGQTTIKNGGQLKFYNEVTNSYIPRSIEGDGVINFDASSDFNPGIYNNLGAPLTIAEGITIRGGYGRLDGFSASAGIVNKGLILADKSGGRLSLYQFTNSGEMRATNNGSLSCQSFVNANDGTITVDGGGSLGLSSAWQNLGAIAVTDGKVTFDGTYAIGDIGTFSRTSQSSVTMSGTILNNNLNWDLDQTTGSVALLNATVKGGTITSTSASLTDDYYNVSHLDGVTLAANYRANSTYVGNGLILANSATLTVAGGVTFNNTDRSATPRSITGGGTIVFEGASATSPARLQNALDADLTLASGLTLRGKFGSLLGSAGARILNDASISADVAGSSLSMDYLTNRGQIQSQNGASISASNFVNSTGGTVQIAAGGSLSLAGTWHNDGIIRLDDQTTLNLGGSFAMEDMGVVNRTGAVTTNITGTLNNSGGTLAPSAGTWVLKGGTINGGTVQATSALQLDSGTLANVTLSGTPAISSSASSLKVTGTLNLDSASLQLPAGKVLAFGSAGATLGGQGQVVLGSGSTISVSAGATGAIGESVEIRGRGRIYGASSSNAISNYGNISADETNQTLTIKYVKNLGGVVSVAAGSKLVASSDYTQSSGTTRIDGSFTSIYPVTIEGGTLAGSGTLSATTSITAGTVCPGGSDSGTLTIAGDVAFIGGGTLEIENAGDVLAINGNLNLSSLDDALHLPASIDTLPQGVVITYTGTLNGIFDEVTPSYIVSYAVPGEISIVAVPEPDSIFAGITLLGLLHRRRVSR